MTPAKAAELEQVAAARWHALAERARDAGHADACLEFQRCEAETARLARLYTWLAHRAESMCLLCMLPLALLGCCPANDVEPATQTLASYDWSAGDPSELAIERWESLRGPLSPACADQVRGTPIAWVEPSEIPVLCGPNAIACYLPGSEIVLPNNATARNAVHEFVHAAALCSLHGTDPDHVLPGMWVNLMCDGTPGSCPP